MIADDNLKILPKYEEYIVYVNKMLLLCQKTSRLNICDE